MRDTFHFVKQLNADIDISEEDLLMEQDADENQVEKFAALVDADELSNDNLIATTSVSAPISETETLEELTEPPVDVPAPTGINKILVEKYGYEWVDGAAYKP